MRKKDFKVKKCKIFCPKNDKLDKIDKKKLQKWPLINSFIIYDRFT